MAKKVGTARDENSEVSERAKQVLPKIIGGATFGWGKDGDYLVDFGKS